MTPSPLPSRSMRLSLSDSVRAELRAGLHELSDALRSGTSSRQSLADSTLHLRVQLRRADLDDARAQLLRDLLVGVAEELDKPGNDELRALANLIRLAADRV